MNMFQWLSLNEIFIAYLQNLINIVVFWMKLTFGMVLLKATVDGIKIFKDLWTWLCKILDGLCKILLRSLGGFLTNLARHWRILEIFARSLGKGWGNIWGSSQGLHNIFSNIHIRIVEDLQGSWESN